MKESGFLDKDSTILDTLKSLNVMESFDDNELHRLLEMSKIRKYKAGECIVQEGRTDTWLYLLMFGQIRISKKDKEITILKRKGEIFGEMGAMETSPRSASAHALTDTACLATDMFYVERLTGNDKLAFGYVLYRLLAEILSRRLRQTTADLINTKSKLNLKFW